MAEQRPIVYFQRLMGNYDRQVAEIMKAKREYLIFADEEEVLEPATVEREPVMVEVLTPKPVPTQLKPKPIVELNAPLEERELESVEDPQEEPEMAPTVVEPEPTPIVQPAEVVTPIVMTPKASTEVKAVSTSMPEPKVAEKKVEEEAPKTKPMTGLGLNLDSIFNEEFSAEQTGYFGK